MIAQTIASRYGLDPTILDGSGLGRQDRTSPQQIVQLLTALWRTRARRSAGGDAADRRRQRHRAGVRVQDAAARHCIAKTGSLDDVSNLAGYCSARGGQQLAFAFFIDGPENSTGFWLESKMISAIARY